jgi:hypothetical protein
MQSLLCTYFDDVNTYFPLLHRPTFERRIAEGLHLRDAGFASTVLLACALGARWSRDPRVFVDGQRKPQEAGWQWFSQVQATMRVINTEPPHLYDLQMAYVSVTSVSNYAARLVMMLARDHVFVWPRITAVIVAGARHCYASRTGDRGASTEGIQWDARC